MSLRSNGNVGIGTTSPGEKLEVSGNIKATNATVTGTLTLGTGAVNVGDTLSSINTELTKKVDADTLKTELAKKADATPVQARERYIQGLWNQRTDGWSGIGGDPLTITIDPHRVVHLFGKLVIETARSAGTRYVLCDRDIIPEEYRPQSDIRLRVDIIIDIVETRSYRWIDGQIYISTDGSMTLNALEAMPRNAQVILTGITYRAK
jgi:hypothetical protein